MSWAALARELGVSSSTLAGLGERRSIEGDGVLQMLAWLGRSPESFVTSGSSAVEGVRLPEPRNAGVLRLDVRALHGALDAARAAQGLTWSQAPRQAESGAAPR